jgi:hypothetical protein
MLNQLRGVYASFQKHKVRYVTIGGVAAILHGVPRTTFDLDTPIEATLENAQHLLDALLDAGLGSAEMTTAQELLVHEITIFRDKVRIDVQTATPGIEFETVWQKKEIMKYRKQAFYVLSREDLIASKRAAGQEKDLEDIRLLELT